MTLRDYLKKLKKAEAKAKFADEVDASLGYLYLVAGSHRNASPKLCEKIETASNGTVTKSELRPDIWPPIPKAA